MVRAYLKDRWWSLAAVTAMSLVVVLARPLFWKILLVVMLVLFPLSYLGYVAWPKWRKPVTARRRVTITLGGVGASPQLISQRLQLVDHQRWLGVTASLLGCALLIVMALRSSDDEADLSESSSP